MIPVSFSEKDLLRGKLVDPPSWYRVLIESVSQAPSKDGGSQNYTVESVIVAEENGSTVAKGIPISWNFNSKAMGFVVPFLQAVMSEEVKPGMRIDLESAVGKELLVMVEHDVYQGRTVNRVNHKYRKLAA